MVIFTHTNLLKIDIGEKINLEKLLILAEANLFEKTLTKMNFNKIKTLENYGQIQIPTTYGIKQI